MIVEPYGITIAKKRRALVMVIKCCYIINVENPLKALFAEHEDLVKTTQLVLDVCLNKGSEDNMTIIESSLQ